MAVIKSILKLTSIQGVVKVSGAAADTATIDLIADLQRAGDPTPVTPSVSVGQIHWFCDKGCTATVTRNSAPIAYLHNTGLSEFYGFVDNSNATDDIAVSFVGGNGVVILELNLTDGYGNNQHQDQGV